MATYIDTTGTDTDYRLEGQRIVVFEIEGGLFPITLIKAAYEESIVVYRADVMPYIELNKGIDWVIRDVDIDYEAIGRAKLVDPSFNKILVKSITISIVPDPQMTVSLDYNTLECDDVLYNSVDAETMDLTPEFFSEVARDIAYLRAAKNPIENLLAQSSTVGPALDVDLTGVNPNNLIQGEIHPVNSQSGVIYIRPVCGSFYRGGVTVRVTSTNVLLTEGVHYRITGPNKNKTMQTSHPSGVYDTIVITSALVGDVTIAYQAFGGGVTRGDIERVYNLILNIVAYINGSSFLTPDSMGGAEPFIKLLSRIGNMEETLRILSTGGTPNYAYSTDGKAFLHRLASPDSTNKHWYTIAKLFRVEGSSTIYTKSQCRFKIMCTQAGLMFDVCISVDATNATNPIAIKVIGQNDKETYVPYTQYTGIEQRIQPEFRVIWNYTTGIESGIFLQIGFNLKHIGVETMAVEDLSGKESCWIAVTPPVIATGPSDDIILMPDGVSIWSSIVSNCKSAIATYTPSRGYLAWGGTLNLNTTVVAPVLLHHMLSPVDIQCKNIKAINFHIWDRIRGCWVVATSKVAVYNNTIRCSNMFDPNDMCSVTLDVAVVGNAFTMNLSSILGNYSKDVNAFELREITLDF